MHTEDGSLRGVDDGCPVKRSENTSVGAEQTKKVSFSERRGKKRERTNMVKVPPDMSSRVSLLSLACETANGRISDSGSAA